MLLVLYTSKVDPGLAVGMADIKTVAVVAHGDLVTFAGPDADQVVRTIQCTVIHD